MPRKDSVTGCMVMTSAEFWAAEDDRAGVDPGTSVREFHEEWNTEERDWLAAHYDPRYVEEMVAEPCREDYNAWLDEQAHPVRPYNLTLLADGKPLPGWTDHLYEWVASYTPPPVVVRRVLVVLHATGRMRLRETNEEVTALVIGEDNQTYRMEFSGWQSSGSFYEPPDYGWELAFKPCPPLSMDGPQA